MTTPKASCPCGTKIPYLQCCGQYHFGNALPKTPEQLMRSRYSAFCKQNADYLVATLHKSARSHNERQQLTNSFSNIQWLGLSIISIDNSKIGEGIGYVEFIARFKHNTEDEHHERSRFIFEKDRWYYIDGEVC